MKTKRKQNKNKMNKIKKMKNAKKKAKIKLKKQIMCQFSATVLIHNDLKDQKNYLKDLKYHFSFIVSCLFKRHLNTFYL